MAPGERLVPIREITAATGHLLKEKAVAADHDLQSRGAGAEGPPSVQDLPHPKADTFLRSLLGGGTTHTVRAVNDVSFDVMRGECLGLVGRSGCGKTTLSKILMRGIAPIRTTMPAASCTTTGAIRSTCCRSPAADSTASEPSCNSSSRTRSARSIRA